MPASRWPRRPAFSVTLLALAWAGAGCAPDDPDAGPAPTLTMSMTQLLPYEGSRRVLLRVDNEGSEPVRITGVGLRWSGFGGGTLEPKDDLLAAGDRLDLRLVLPREQCDAGREPVLGVVRTTEATVEQALTATGTGFVEQLWARRCFVARLHEQVTVSYGDTWSRDPSGSALDGALEVERRAAGEPLRFTRAVGSVLYRVEVVRPATMTVSQPRLGVPLRIGPGNRCDEHAIGQATAPFTFKYGVEIGGAAEDLLTLTPPPRLQQQITDLLLDHCRRKGDLSGRR